MSGRGSVRTAIHARLSRGHARDRRQSARTVRRGAAADWHGGPQAGARSGSVQPRRPVRARQDRAPGLRRPAGAAGDHEIRARAPAAGFAGAPGHAASRMRNAIEQSYDYCRHVARSRAKNFYYSFLLLSAQQRKAMCAIYAFMRICDDLSDEPGASRDALERWRGEMEDALDGRFSGHPLWPAFHHTVRRFGIPHDYLREMIDGVVSDLEPRRFQAFDELYRYCYQVASVVGLTVIYIF